MGDLVAKLAALSTLIDDFVKQYQDTKKTKEEKEKSIEEFLASVVLQDKSNATSMQDVKSLLDTFRAEIASKTAENESLKEDHGVKAGSLEGELAKSAAELAASEEKLKAALSDNETSKSKIAELEVEKSVKESETAELSEVKSKLESEKLSSQAKLEEIEQKIKKVLSPSEPPAATPVASSAAASAVQSGPPAAAPGAAPGAAKGGRRTLRRNGSKRRKNKLRKTTSRWRN